ncbi:MAG: hypothetical protein V4714_06870 [Bacteroidota bacterium]
MKKLTTTLCFFAILSLCSWVAYGQNIKPDKIVKRDKKVIEAIVQEVTMNGEISYKKFTSPKGALFKIPVKDVASIEYASGYIDEFPDEPVIIQAPAPTTPASSRDSKPATATEETSAPVLAKTEPKPVPTVASVKEAKNTASTKTESRKVSNKGVEISSKAVTGLDYDRVPMENLQADVRSADEYAGEYQWRRNVKGPRETAYLIAWDNVNLSPKEWTGYSWRHKGKSERDVKLKGNKLIVSGKTLGSFVKFDANGKEMRGFMIESEDGKDLFLWKIK